jgi:hypothetical protein
VKLSQTSSLQLFPLFQRWRLEGKADRADSVAQYFAQQFARDFEESVVLARVYIALPYDRATPRQQAFAKAIAEKSQEPITNATSLLCLAGTAGKDAAWNEVGRSQGHVAIPLTSAAFVSSLPMVAELFSQLGLLSRFFPKSAEANAAKQKNRSLFFVPDARSSKDSQGRFIIPARDFVTTHGVGSVFGGGERFDDDVSTCFLVFSNEVLPDTQVEAFSAMSHLLLAAMTRSLARRSYFG